MLYIGIHVVRISQWIYRKNRNKFIGVSRACMCITWNSAPRFYRGDRLPTNIVHSSKLYFVISEIPERAIRIRRAQLSFFFTLILRRFFVKYKRQICSIQGLNVVMYSLLHLLLLFYLRKWNVSTYVCYGIHWYRLI